MRTAILTRSAICLLFLFLNSSLHGQRATDDGDKVPAVFLWQTDDSTMIEANVSAAVTPGSKVGTKIYMKVGSVSKLIVDRENVVDCLQTVSAGEICKEMATKGIVQFKYRFASRPPDGAHFEFAYFLNDVRKGDLAQILKVSPMSLKTKPNVRTMYSSEKKDFRSDIKGRRNGEIVVGVQFVSQGSPLSDEARNVIEDRIRSLYLWLEPKTVTPDGVAIIRAEPTTREIPGNIPFTYDVSAMRLEPAGARQAVEQGGFNIILVPSRDLPTGKYDLEVAFQNAPEELDGKMTNSLTGVAMKQADAGKIEADRTFGNRDLKNNFDLALAYTSSVDSVRVGNRTARERQNNGILDLRFAPLLDYHRDADNTNFFTPIFIDAKVSTGKIDKKSLSLNRIVIGSEYMRRFVDLNTNNKYIFSFRGVSASDRDFKRAEAKFEFQFRPVLDLLNKPLADAPKEPAPPSVLIESNGGKIVPCCHFGYHLEPFIGFELGRVYREKRGAFDVEDSSKNVRRLYFGFELLLNLTQYANLKITDTFYVRGEDVRDHTRNYFRGEIQAPLFTSGDTSQCLFFSFERGDQPPFATPSVNSFKLGYRITSNFFKQRP